MATIHAVSRELTFKIVFYGPGRSGKTSSLQTLHDQCPPERRGKLVHLPASTESTLFFDYLPLRIPKAGDASVRLQLFTVPGQVRYNSTRKLLLTGTDGIVFIADSDRSRAEANVESLENLKENLREQRRTLGEIPHLFQYNKRDLETVISEQELNDTLNLHNAPTSLTMANQGVGVFDTLDRITRAIFENFEGGLTLSADIPSFFPTDTHQEAIPSTFSITQFFEATPDPPFSFSLLWPETSRSLISELELAIASGQQPRAADSLQVLATQCLRDARATLPSAQSLQETAIVALLGLPVSRYASFFQLVDFLARGGSTELPALLAAYSFVIDLRVACLVRNDAQGQDE